MTERAKEALAEADTVAGYKTYIDLIRPLLREQTVAATGMRQEVERCREVVRLAGKGHRVALVSSGDAGIYGMAGILIECLSEADLLAMPLEIIPGITAANAAAAVLGAPLMHDFAAISLSDLLTPWDVILRRVHLAAEGDFVIALYNPKSAARTEQIGVIREVLLQYRAAETPVGIVREALRGPGSAAVIRTLANFTQEKIDMLSTVIIGNSQTRRLGPYLVTPRGYSL
ncbi:Precorrin-3B C17-methyltransferase domain protein [Acididesulfobacillus acetoxydans]|uniref:Cobalt-precorrin-3B C(17)-methyltransferase n=1 Tax=Acididesulfobacillus acetoxydans TaxID=1561005 RepID=A0A8S0XC25_9FIRM|nr:precorrin-3B C(17)-methyltransferase [Acididesulfobacillus acetoxydans]CAA7601906.1 Precorrin-3B C17-methyltransferase domain protein [Acididesulfobacillus acetoxydans]CEJ08250.1 Cobalt-precorrin-3B C(17)-methyltransferase [Acididesulfobacillus acetoxydans]